MVTTQSAKFKIERETIESSSGNVFADLGLPDAEELLIKSQIAISIAELVDHRGWTIIETARRAEIDQVQMSNVLRGRLVSVSVDRLFAILNQLARMSVELD